MNDFSYLTEKAAAARINERVEERRRSAIPGRTSRRANRHSLARRLHRLADALDG